MSNPSWDEYFIRLAEQVSTKSNDRSTKVGAVIVGPRNEVRSTGYNNFPAGVKDGVEERYKRPQKYEWTEHAERNAIFTAARHGAQVGGCRLYLNFFPLPCVRCARAIINAGIVEIVGPERQFSGAGEHWEDEFERTIEMLDEAGVKRRSVGVEISS